MASRQFADVISTGEVGVGTSYVTVYTLPLNRQAALTRVNICNKHGSQILIDIRSTKNGDVIQEVLSRPLGYGGDPFTHDGTLNYKTFGDKLEVKCDQAAGCDVSVDGTEFI